jgi:TolB protein
MAYDPDNNLSNRLTYNGYRDWAPKINRRTDQIAFTSDSLVKTYIYTIDRNGGDIQKITNIEVDGYHNEGNAFAWDEDAGKLIFSHYNELYEINSDGTSLNKLATAPAGRHFREVDLSPDYQKIVALTIGEKVYHSEIYLMERDGSNPQVLIDSLEGIVESPSFSIDGESILFTHDVSGNEALDGRMLNSHIFRLDIATMDTTDLSTNKPLGTNDLQPTYSPTGDKIVFMNVVNDNSKPKEIWMMDVDGTNREKIIDDAEQPHWN